jgi:hypothetical protein
MIAGSASAATFTPSRRLAAATGFVVDGTMYVNNVKANYFDPTFGLVPDICFNTKPCGNVNGSTVR